MKNGERLYLQVRRRISAKGIIRGGRHVALNLLLKQQAIIIIEIHLN